MNSRLPWPTLYIVVLHRKVLSQTKGDKTREKLRMIRRKTWDYPTLSKVFQWKKRNRDKHEDIERDRMKKRLIRLITYS